MAAVRVFQPWTLQTTVSCVALARLWLAVPDWTGPVVTTLSEELQTMLNLVGIACPPSHAGHSFPGFHLGTLYRCASWRTAGVVVDDDDRSTVRADRLAKDFSNAHHGCIQATSVDRVDPPDKIFGIEHHHA